MRSDTATLVQGKAPSVQVAMDLHHLLGESSTHLRQPVGLEMQLLEVDDMDTEVGNSMLQLLQVWLALDCQTHDALLRYPCNYMHFESMSCGENATVAHKLKSARSRQHLSLH